MGTRTSGLRPRSLINSGSKAAPDASDALRVVLLWESAGPTVAPRPRTGRRYALAMLHPAQGSGERSFRPLS